MRKECIRLEHRVDRSLVGRSDTHLFAEDLDRTFRGKLEAGNHSQRSRFAAPGWSEQREELTVTNIDIDSVYGDYFITEPFGHTSKADR